MSTSQFTTSTGAIIPATCDQHTPLDLLPKCVQAYHEATGGTVALDTLTQAVDAMRDASAIVTLYVDARGEIAARALWPVTVGITKGRNVAMRAYDTRHRTYRTFRIDRVIACHPLTTPDDAEPREEAIQEVDTARIALRLGETLVALTATAHLDMVDTARLADAMDDARRIYKAVSAA